MKRSLWLTSLLLGSLFVFNGCTDVDPLPPPEPEVECRMDSDCVSKGDNKICSARGVCVTVSAVECDASFTPVCAGPSSVMNCVDGKRVSTSCAQGKVCTVCTSSSTERECQIFESVNGNDINVRTGRAVCVSSSNECDPNTVPVCVGTDQIKYCTDGHYEYTRCEFGCKAGACKKSACTSLEDSTCIDAKTSQVCVNGAWQNIPCEYECSKGVCVDAPTCDPTAKAKCSEDYTAKIACGADGKQVKTTCGDGQYCNEGECISVSAIKEGMECNSNTAPTFCNGTKNGYCTSGVFKLEECTEYGMYCDYSVVDGVREAACAFDCVAEKFKEGDIVAYTNSCEYWDSNEILIYAECKKGESGKIGGFDIYSSEFVCLDSKTQLACSPGSKKASQVSCPGGCSDNVCEGGSIVPVVSCDPDTYVEKCDGNTLYYCSDGDETTANCNAQAPCSINMDGVGDCAVPCKNGDPSEIMCLSQNGVNFAVPMACLATKTGSYGYFLDYNNVQQCTGACTDGTGCSDAPANPDLGKSCDSNTYPDQCDGNNLYYCYGNKVTGASCNSQAPCTIRSDGYGDCAAACKKGDPSEIVCIQEGGVNLAVSMVCSATKAGGYAYFMDFENYEECAGACTDGVGCSNAPANPEVGKACNPNTYPDKCEGNDLYYCYENTIDVASCNAQAPCTIRSDGYGDCAVACKNGDPSEIVCMSQGNVSFAVPMVCSATKTGGYAYFMGDDYEVCTGTCTDGVGCK